jgi:hypothetical protein
VDLTGGDEGDVAGEHTGRDWVWRNYPAKPGTISVPPRVLVRFLEDGGTVPCMGGMLVRRAAVEQVGGWEDSFQRVCTDQVFHAKLCLRFPVMILDACLDRYRQHESSSCRTAARAGELDQAFERYLIWLTSYVSAQPGVDPAVRVAVRRALRRHRHPRLRQLERRLQRDGARLRQFAARAFGRALPRPLRRRPGSPER